MEIIQKMTFALVGALTFLYSLSIVVPKFSSQDKKQHFLTVFGVSACLLILDHSLIQDVLIFYSILILMIKVIYQKSTFIASLSVLFVYLIQILASMIAASTSVMVFHNLYDFRIVYDVLSWQSLGLQVIFVILLSQYYKRLMAVFRKVTHLNTRIERVLIASNIIVFSLILLYQRLTFNSLVDIAASHILKATHLPSVRFYVLTSYALMTGLTFLVVFLINRLCIVDNNMETYKYKAETDLMTGVLSREAGLKFLKDEMLNASVTGNELTIAYIDINDLKMVNDRYGHKEGDRMILKITEIIESNLRDRDIIARLGGDEFMVVFKKCNLLQAKKVWLRINETFLHVNAQNQFAFKVSASAGFAQYHTAKHPSVMHLVNEADEAMYVNKKQIKAARL